MANVRFFARIALFMALLLVFGMQTTASNAFAETYELYIGVEDYPGEVNDLEFCVDDAIKMEAALEEYEEWQTPNRQFLFDTQATVANIESAIAAMAAEAGPGDTCLIYFSGHGTRVPNAAEADRYDEAICARDGDITDDMLGAWLSAISPEAYVIAIFDSCFSGGLAGEPESKAKGGTAGGAKIKSIHNPSVPGWAKAKKHFGRGLGRHLARRGRGARSDSGDATPKDTGDIQGLNFVVGMGCAEKGYSYELYEIGGLYTDCCAASVLMPEESNSNGDNILSTEEALLYAKELTEAFWGNGKPKQSPQLYDGNLAAELLLAEIAPPEPTLIAIVSTNKGRYKFGETVYITVTVTDNLGNPFPDAAVDVLVACPNSSYALTPDHAGNGVFTSTFIPALADGSGSYLVTAIASDPFGIHVPGDDTTAFTVKATGNNK